MAVYRLIDKQTHFNQAVRNVYHYESDSGGSAEDLINAFTADVLPSILAAQSDSLTHGSIEAYNLDDDSDWHAEALVGAAGDLTGDGDAPFVAVKVTLFRTTRATRNGFKRFGGIADNEVNQGVLNEAAILRWQTVADAVSEDIALLGATYSPVILGYTRDATTGEVTGYITNAITGGEVDPQVTTQNTRKFGRGI